MTKVRCSVDNCEFWGKGDICKAEAIWVNSNSAAIEEDALLFDSEFATELGALSNSDSSSAMSSRQTCCATMRPRESK